MKIKKLDLLNIRGYENANLEFSPTINLLIGENNSGKSTILKALQLLQKSFSSLSTADIRKTYSSGKIRIQLVDSSPEEYSKLYKDAKLNSLISGKTFSVLFHFKNDLPNNNSAIDSYIVDEAKWNIDVTNSTITAISQISDAQHLPDFKPFNSMEDEGNFIYLFLSKRKPNEYSGNNGKISALSIDDDFRNLPSKIKLLSNRSHNFHEEYQLLCDGILGFPIGCAPGSSNNNEDKIAVLVNHESIYLESMGEGVANILGLLSILCTESNKLFLIEEIENDIHPLALKKLLNLIINKSSDNQFIISTHSNIVLKYLAAAPDAKIFYTEGDNLPVNTHSRTLIPTSKISEIENTLERRLEILEELGYDLLDFDLYGSFIIFEESSCEQIVKEFLIPEYVPNLINKINTVSAGGTAKIEPNFESFLRLFVYINNSQIYRNKAWVIADGDEAGITATTKLKEKFKYWPESTFRNFTKSNFEEYYPASFKEEFYIIKKVENKKERFKQKGDLTQKVLKWIRANREEAIKEFEISAAEVINLLKEIDQSVNNK